MRNITKWIIAAIFGIFLMGGQAFAANYPLEIIQPQPNLNIKNRFYKAYPDFVYNVRLAIIGGVYPFTHELTTAPSGMTIDSGTGEINWLNPKEAASPYNVTAKVTDQEGSIKTVSWTITVTTNGFRFLDAINGKSVAQGGTGAFNNPWKSIVDMYEGNDYASKRKNSYANEFLYFKTGTYVMNGFLLNGGGEILALHANKPIVWLAYPKEFPVLDMGLAKIISEDGSRNIYFDGFTINNITNKYRKAIQIDSNSSNVTFRNNTFHHLTSMPGSWNQSAIMIAHNGVGKYWSFQNNTFYDIRHGYGIIGYSASRVLFENNIMHDFSDPLKQGASHVIGPKEGTSMWFIRANTLYNIDGDGIDSLYSNTSGIIAGHMEISYNLVRAIGNTFSLRINTGNYGQIGDKVYVFRNTLIGRARVGYTTLNNGPFYFNNNVIINNTSFKEHIECLSCAEPSRLIVTDNLSGFPSDNIVDSGGNLTPAYSQYIGTHGHVINANSVPPNTANILPIPSATEVPKNTNISFDLNDRLEGIDLSTIKVTVQTGTNPPVTVFDGANSANYPNSTITPTTSPSNYYTFIYNPPADFNFNDVVTLAIDASDNISNVMTQKRYSFSIETYTPPAILTTTLPNAYINKPYNFTLQAEGTQRPYQWTISGNPNWMAANSSGNLSGTPASIGQYTLTVNMADNDGISAIAKNYILTVKEAPLRAIDGLVALYDFTQGSGSTIYDRSGAGTAMNLTISNSNAVQWISDNNGASINFTSAGIAKSSDSTKLLNSVKATGNLTIEAWIKPANTTQTGPSRIVTFSQDPSNRNFTLGQAKGNINARLRTTTTSVNGGPSLTTQDNPLSTNLVHVVTTYDGAIKKIYVDGVENAAVQTLTGDFSTWAVGHTFALGNEITNDRSWLGKIYMVAIYNRALPQAEVTQNFGAGSDGGAALPPVNKPPVPRGFVIRRR